jgi:alanyl-tRNA synthetase
VIQTIAKASNGKGGGRKDFAQGACTADNLEVFVNSIPDIVQSIA